MAVDDTDQIMCSQVQTRETQYWNDIELSQTVSEMLSGLPASPDVNSDTNFDLKFETSDINLPKIKTEETESESRFAAPVGESEIRKLLENQKNPNTRKNTNWAYNVFSAWRKERGAGVSDITEMDAPTMEFWLSRFVVEARKEDGSEYPAKSLYYLVCGLLRLLRNKIFYSMNFLDEKDKRFANFRKVLDSRTKELVHTGVGTTVKQAEVILPEHEEKLWETGVFGDHSAKSLQYTVYYYSYKIFGLRSCDEHRSLECTQFTVGKDDGDKKYIHFVGQSNKTYKGGLAQVQLKQKDIKHYCAEGPRCLADLFEKYLNALSNRGFFFRRRLKDGLRYSEAVVGINKLKTFVSTKFKRAGIEGNFTNHSGKRTCATLLFRIDEQEIMSRTGHRSEKGLREYIRATPAVIARTSVVLDPPQY